MSEMPEITEGAAQAAIDNIADNAERIYVRARVEGEWGSYSLAELPQRDAMRESMRLVLRSLGVARV